MNIVVVGGAGFIGSHLVDRLLAEGNSVDVIDNLSTGTLGNLADARASTAGELKIHHLDAASTEAASLIGMRQPDVVVHLCASERRVGQQTDQVEGLANSLNIVEACRQHGVGKLVVALPATTLYGFPAVNSLPVKEGNPEPRGVRGIVARAVLDVLAHYREHASVEFAALALASVYGPRQSPDSGVVAAFAEAVAAGGPVYIDGDGRQTRDFVYIDDVVDALVRASERSGGLLINIGTGQQTSIRELWSMMQADPATEVIHRPQRPGELHRFAVAPARARIHLAWSAWTELADGIVQVQSGAATSSTERGQ